MKTVQDARMYAASVNRRIADEALTADYYASHITLEDRMRIKREQNTLADEIEKGIHDHNLTIMQRMHYYMTGESIPLLP